MGFAINDIVKGQLFIDNKEVPLSAASALHMAHISCSTTQRLPILVIVLTDNLGAIAKIGLHDGSVVTLAIRGFDKPKVRTFRVYKWTTATAGASGVGYRIECYLDSPMYWMGTDITTINGTSTNALKAIAAKCGLEWDSNNTNTNDSMVWAQGNRLYGEWAKDIAYHGYAGDKSHLVLAITDMGVMKYVDVQSLAKSSVQVGFEDVQSGSGYKITDFKPTIASGVYNAVAGYRHSRYVQQVESYVEDQVDVDLVDNNLMISGDIRSSVSRMGVSFSPINFGTVHEKYERAEYQHDRYNSIKSVQGEFLFPFPTDLNLLDNFKYKDPKLDGTDKYSGYWSIKSKVIYIQGPTYFEKITAIRIGTKS